MEPLWFEDYVVGAEHTTSPRVITDADIATFAALSGDDSPLHTDEAYAQAGPFGRRVAHGLLGLAVASGLMIRSGLGAGTLVAFLGLEWSFRRPIFPGDPVRVRVLVLQRRPTRDPGRGLVKLGVALLDPGGEVAQEGTFTVLVRVRGSVRAPPEPSAGTDTA